ncbi:MAG: hypothetical protein ACREJD_05300 [Phycisphaerales bacterium]
MGKIILKTFTLADIPPNGLLDLYEDPNGYLAPNNSAWVKLLRENPHAKPDDLVMLLAIDQEEDGSESVVGRLGVLATAWSINGQEHRIHEMDGFFLDESRRQTGAGAMIILHAIARCKTMLACGGPSADAQKLYKAAGMKEIGPLKRWVYFLSGRPVAKKVLKSDFLANALSLPAGLAARAMYTLRGAQSRAKLEYKKVDRFDSRIDAVVAASRRSFFPRDSRVLNWALAHRRIKAFEVSERGTLIGFVLLKRSILDATQHGLGRVCVGNVLDYFLADETRDRKRDLALFTLRHFESDPGDGDLPSEQGRVEVIEFQVFDPEFDAILKGMGLLHAGGLRVLFRPPPGASFDQNTPWFFTHASGDMLLMKP